MTSAYRRLKPREIASLREELLAIQNNLCALCLDIIQEGEAVLDHDHATGQIRGVLHRGCNALEGHIVNAMPRNRITQDRLRNILARLQQYQQELKPLLHPTHRTPEERRQRAKRRAKSRRTSKTKV